MAMHNAGGERPGVCQNMTLERDVKRLALRASTRLPGFRKKRLRILFQFVCKRNLSHSVDEPRELPLTAEGASTLASQLIDDGGSNQELLHVPRQLCLQGTAIDPF
jgi:hypothetical protein